MILALAWALTMSGISYAQDRGWATAIAWSPDGETIAVGSSTGLWLFDNEFNEIGFVATPEFEGVPPTTIDWHTRGDLLAIGIGNYDNYHDNRLERSLSGVFPILVVDFNRRAVISRVKYSKLTSPIRWHPIDHVLLTGQYSGATHVIDALSGEAIYTYSQSYDKLAECCNSTIAVCWLGTSSVAAITQYEIYVADIIKNQTIQRFGRPAHSELFRIAACDASRKAITTNNYRVDLRAEITSRLVSSQGVAYIKYWYDGLLANIAYSPDGSKIVINGTGSGCRAAVYDRQSFELLAAIQGSYSQSWVFDFTDSIAWHPASSQFAIVGQFDIRIWDATTFELLQRYDGFEAGYYRLFSLAEGLSEEERIAEMYERGITCPD